MKNIFLLALVFFLTFSCKKREPEIKQDESKADAKVEINTTENESKSLMPLFFKDEKICSFKLSSPEFLSEIDSISNGNVNRFSVSKQLREEIAQGEGYYKLVHYSKTCFENSNFNVFTVFGNYDYYNRVILVTMKENTVIDTEIIAAISGDGDYEEEIISTWDEDGNLEKRKYEKGLIDGSYQTKSEICEVVSLDANGEIRVTGCSN